MKKAHLIIIGLLTAVMTMICMSCTAYAKGEMGFALEQDTNEAAPGGTLEITLKGSNLESMYAYEAIISYDPAIVEFDRAESMLEGFFMPPKTKEGKMIIAFTKIGKKDGESGDMPLCTVAFKGKAQGDANIRLVSVKALDPNLTVSVFNLTNGEEEVPDKTSPAVKTFADLDGYEWAKMQIEALAGQGIIKGTSETTFSPGQNITRADFICLLVRALGFDAEIDSDFADVTSTDYFYKEVGIAKKIGIVVGVGDGRLLPREPISRQDMMVIISRAMKAAGKELDGSAADLDRFTDSDEISGYALDAAAQLVKEGIIIGSGGRINPKSLATRAETAVIIYRLLNR